MIRGHQHGRVAVWLVLGLAVLALAWVAVPLHVVARALLVLALLGVGMGVLVGARGMVDRLLPWCVGLLVVAVGWPILINALRSALAGPPLMVGRVPTGSATLGDSAFHATTCLMVLGLILLAVGILLVAARVHASLPPAPHPPRVQARRRARLVEPARADDVPAQPRGSDDDFGLLGGGEDGP